MKGGAQPGGGQPPVAEYTSGKVSSATRATIWRISNWVSSVTAIGSSNYHEDHFGDTFGLHLADGSAAHSACIGFGLDRITLALFATHGTDVDGWPAEVKAHLALA